VNPGYGTAQKDERWKHVIDTLRINENHEFEVLPSSHTFRWENKINIHISSYNTSLRPL
jgi:hypothetical protein